MALNETVVVISAVNAYEWNKLLFGKQLASFFIMGFFSLIFVLWLYILIFSSLKRVSAGTVFKFLLPLFVYFGLIAIWVFINLYFAKDLWGFL